jgi:ABC-type polysaccharide/polyol phosphate export permease
MNQADIVPVYDSARLGFPAFEELREALNYRHLIQQLIRRDTLARYKRSVLGVAWTMLHPLAMMLVRVIVFSTIFGRDPGYPVYVLSGLLAFNFFSEATNTTIKNLVWGGELLKRIYIPRSVFAIASVGAGMVNLLISILPLILVTLGVGLPIRLVVFYLPVGVILLTFFTLGFGMLISVTAAFYPDAAEMYKVVLRAWLYLTPIIYPERILPDTVLKLIRIFNPMYYLVNIFRLPVYEARLPTWMEFWPGALVSVLVLIIGWLVFSYKAHEFSYRV